MAPEDTLDLLNAPSTVASGYLTCDSHANSDYEDTDGEASAYTDGEGEDAYDQPGLARSSEPAQLAPSHGLDSSEPAQLAPSPSKREQVGAPEWYKSPVGQKRLARWPLALGHNSHPGGTGRVSPLVAAGSSCVSVPGSGCPGANAPVWGTVPALP